MNMPIKIACILLVVCAAAACHSQNDQDNYPAKEDSTSPKIISIEGTAQNSKASAILLVDDKVYHIEGMLGWDDEMLNKIVIVKGEVVQMPAEQTRDADGGYRQAIGSPYTVIKNSTWWKK
ncbi:MAG: hypothetical protein HN337_06725 [Deltaproteobacteria bacterium]|jgi:hypothetical protein|nr:hypothetical protein [Deltaproteobacteria bacterium]